MGHIKDFPLHDNGVWPLPFDMGHNGLVEVRRQKIKKGQPIVSHFKKETSIMNDITSIFQKIDDINIQIMDMLMQAKSSLDMYDVISANAKTINQKPRNGDLWGFIQKMTLDSLILSICKVFEKDKVNGHEQNSISRVIAIIEINAVEPKYPEPISEFLKKYAIEVSHPYEGKFTIFDFCTVCKKFKDKYEKALGKIKTARDKIVAHNDANQKVMTITSIADIGKILEFGYDFYSAISKAYIGVGPIEIKTHKRKKNSLEHLFKQLGFVAIPSA